MFVKSSRPTYKRRVKKAQEGIKFATYTPVEVNQTDYRDLTSIDNPFNEFNFATTYDKPTALVVPETTETKNEVETKSEPVVNNPTPPVVVNKPTQNVSTSTTWRSPYKDRAKWTKDLSDAYRKVGITNDNAIRMLLAQDALESGWGKSAQGKYNFGNLTTGSSWKGNYVVGNDKNAKGEAIKQKFRAYESMDDYAKDKIQFLKRLYDFDENDDINKFVAKLTGANKGKRKYAENVKYANLLTNVYNSFKDGGVIRYDGGGVAKRDAVTNYRPEIPTRIRKATPAEYIKSVVNIYGQNQSQVSPDNRSKWQHEQASKQADKGYTDYMEAKKTEQGLDRLNQFLTFTDVAGLATGVGSLATKGISYAGKQATKQLAKHTVGREFKRQSKYLATPTQSMPNNVGWGPRQTIKGAIHDKDTMEPLKLYSPKRYDAVNEGAPKAGVWFQGKLGIPRTAANHSIPGKAEKAAKARDLFAKRPVRVEGDLELNKPLVTVGDVPNRAQIQRAADTMGGDGVIFNDVYDNGYGRNQVVFSYRTDLKNGRMFKKGTNVANNEVSRATSIGDLLKSRGFGESDNFKLPDYATPNSPSDPMGLHALRLSNGGFDKLPKTVNGQTHFNSGSFNWPYKSESMATNLHAYDVDPTEWIDKLSTDFSKASRGAVSSKDLHPWALDRANNETLFATSGTNNIYIGHKGITKTAKEFGEKNVNRLISHEMDHAIHIPGEPPKGFDLDYLMKSTPEQPNYFPTKNSTELAARGSQLKDYFGLTSPDQELTEDMLRYAAKNYVKDTGTDNNMTAFFKSITDWKEAAKWLSEWSSAVAVPVIITNKK